MVLFRCDQASVRWVRGSDYREFTDLDHQTFIRAKLEAHLDKQEVNELLQTLLDKGLLRRRSHLVSLSKQVAAADWEEEEATSWMVTGDRTWFGMDFAPDVYREDSVGS